MSDLLGARRLRELLEEHGVRPRKQFGQNFVIDPNTIRKVIETAGLSPGDRVVEIGAGAGSLTLGLAAAAGRVIALELDDRLLPVLEATCGAIPNVEIVEADALQYDFAAAGAASVVANLPYNIAVPVVMRILEAAPNIGELTVMTQREVGERLAASPGSKAYGGVSVLVRYVAEARVAGRVSRRAFYPVPGVDSVIVRIVRHAALDVDRGSLEAVVRAAFGQRRKTLRNTLAGLMGGPAAAEAALRRAGIDPGARAEEVGVDGFLALARNIE